MKNAEKLIAFFLVCLMTASSSAALLRADAPEAAQGTAQGATQAAPAAENAAAGASPSASAGKEILEQRREDLAFLYGTLKKYHPDIFANTPEETFQAKLREIEGKLGQLSDFDFVLELQSLAALIGDSHTSTQIGAAAESLHFFPLAISWFDGHWVISNIEKTQAAALGKTVTAVNGRPVEEFRKEYGRLLSADNDVKLRRQFQQVFYVEEIMAWLGLTETGEDLTLSLEDEQARESRLTLTAVPAQALKEMAIASLADERKAKALTDYDKTCYYKSLPLDNATYYIQYNLCLEAEDLPMETFAAQVEKALAEGNYRQVILDLRYNGGGSDGVLRPILTLLTHRHKELKLFCLIDEATFSSATINSIMIAEAGGILAGSPASGSVDHFGAIGSFTLPNSGLRVSLSSKFIDLGSYFESARPYGVESLRPDVEINLTLADYLAGVDTAVSYIQKQGLQLTAPGLPKEAVLTRGRFIGMLGQLTEELNGSPLTDDEPAFIDGWDFAWYYPYLNWAAHQGLTGGVGGGMFAPARAITRQEMAAILARYLEVQNYVLPALPALAPADGDRISVWAKAGVNRVLELGLMKTDAAGSFNPEDTCTIAEAEAVIAALT